MFSDLFTFTQVSFSGRVAFSIFTLFFLILFIEGRAGLGGFWFFLQKVHKSPIVKFLSRRALCLFFKKNSQKIEGFSKYFLKKEEARKNALKFQNNEATDYIFDKIVTYSNRQVNCFHNLNTSKAKLNKSLLYSSYILRRPQKFCEIFP